MKAILIELFVAFFGAFSGFLFAMILDRMEDRRKEKIKYALIVKNLVDELSDIYSSLKKYHEHETRLNARIATPTWDALQYSGTTLELIDKPFFDDLVKTYALIKAYNEDYKYNKQLEVNKISVIVDSCKKALVQMETEVNKNVSKSSRHN